MQRTLPAGGTQPGQVCGGGLGAGQDDQVGRRHRLARADEGKFDLRMRAQGIEISVVRNARRHRHHDFQRVRRTRRLFGLDRIFGIELQAMQVRHHAEHRLAGLVFEPDKAGVQQGLVAAKPVDHETARARLLGSRQAIESAGEMSEHAAAVNVGDQHHRAIGGFCEAHVGDVAVAQVDLGRTACALDQHHLILAPEARIGFEHRSHRAGLVVVIGARIHVGAHLAVDDDLRAGVGARLEQDRIHVGVRREAGSLRLKRLGAADLAAVGRDCAVERHVLRFERHHGDAAAPEHPGQPCNQRALARVRGCALNHQRATHRKHFVQRIGLSHRPRCDNGALCRLRWF